MINEFSQISWYRVNMQKSNVFLYTSNKLVEINLWSTNTVYKSILGNQIPRDKSNNDIQRYTTIYNDVYKTPKLKTTKSIKEGLSKWRNIYMYIHIGTWIRSQNIVKTWILIQLVCKLNVILILKKTVYFVLNINKVISILNENEKVLEQPGQFWWRAQLKDLLH